MLFDKNRQCTVKKNEVLKIQEVAQKRVNSEGKLEDLKEKHKKAVAENKNLNQERKSGNEQNSNPIDFRAF